VIDWERIEQGFERFLELVRRDRRVGEELERSRGDFFIGPLGARAAGAERRHLEWFLLERPSAALGAVPAQAWADQLGTGASDLSAAFLQSLPGAFELTSLVADEGFWVRDLFTHGEHPVTEGKAGAALEVGDLLVGRLYPAGGGAFLLSPAVSLFRNRELLAAVRADLEQMRLARRGVLRVQQLELERLFHSPPAAGAAAANLEDTRAEARQALVGLGLDAEQVAEVLTNVHGAALTNDGQVFIEILNRLAFDTGIDLASARLVLTTLWHSERTSAPASLQQEDGGPRDPRSALEAFDRGRAEGKDLELLFRELERDLGVDEESDEGEDEGESAEDLVAPDFPGVVGAMVEEFLWDSAREGGEERAHTLSSLRLLSEYASEIGVFEELNSSRLLDFSARWLLDESGLSEASELVAVMDALAAFCKWCEEDHDFTLWSQFGSTLDSIRRSIPRHTSLRARLAAGRGAGAHRVVSLSRGTAVVHANDGRETSLALSPLDFADLRDGDLVRLAGPAGQPVLGATYPAELAELFS